MTFSIKKISKKVWIPVAIGLCFLLSAGIVIAATAYHFTGHVTVTSSTPSPTGDFMLTTSTGGDVTNAYFTIGMETGNQVVKTVRITKTGTAASVNVSIVASSITDGLTVVPSESSVTVGDTPVDVDITISATTTGEKYFNLDFARVQ